MKSKYAIAIIQARLSSSRLPGKVLLQLKNKPVIQHIVDRVDKCKYIDKIVVATSTENSDDQLVRYCEMNRIDYHRGSLNNVLSRFVEILSKIDYDHCVRITGDCPLICPEYIDAQIKAVQKFSADLTWTKHNCFALEGQGVISKKAINHVNCNTSDPNDREHVGSNYFLKNHNNFKYVKMKIPGKYYKNNFRLTIDEKEDYQFMSNIFNQKWSDDPAKLDEVLNWLEKIDNSLILNRDIKDSLVNKNLKKARMNFTPKVEGTYLWDGF